MCVCLPRVSDLCVEQKTMATVSAGLNPEPDLPTQTANTGNSAATVTLELITEMQGAGFPCLLLSLFTRYYCFESNCISFLLVCKHFSSIGVRQSQGARKLSADSTQFCLMVKAEKMRTKERSHLVEKVNVSSMKLTWMEKTAGDKQ